MKVAIYMRLACKSENSFGPLKAQELQLRQYAKDYGYDIVKTIAEYGSGLNLNRSGLSQLLTDPISEYEGVLVTDLSRIGRNLVKTIAWCQQLKCTGKKLYLLNDSHEYNRMSLEDTLLKKMESYDCKKIP